MSASFEGGHALLIGVGADLPFTIDDASYMANILKDPERCAYPEDQVKLLIGEKAYRQAILDALDRLADAADESSTVLIYFSGHGYRAITTIGEAYFLMPFGARVDNLKGTAIKGSEFASRLEAIRSKKLLLLLDCCHAGGVDISKGVEAMKSPLPPEALEILKHGKGRVIIASCEDNEFSYGGRPYSAFTLALIEAFSGVGAQKHDGFVRAADLAMYAREKVPRRTNGKQHPILHFEEADNFEIAYYAGGSVQPKGLPFVREPEIEPEPGAWNVFIGGDVVNMPSSIGTVYRPRGTVNQQQSGGIAELLRYAYVGHLEIYGGSLPAEEKMLNASADLSLLREWKEMHTKAHDILDRLSPVASMLYKCQYESISNLDAQFKLIDDQWKISRRSLQTLPDIIEGFSYIKADRNVMSCLDYAYTSANISKEISAAKTFQDAARINNLIGEIIETFEITLMRADLKIVKLVDDFTHEITKMR